MTENHENLYNQLISVNEKLGSLAKGQADLVESQKSIVEQFKKLNGQVQKHASFINTWKGKLAMIGTAVGAVGYFIGLWIKKNFID